jgi:hypothetical protein
LEKLGRDFTVFLGTGPTGTELRLTNSEDGLSGGSVQAKESEQHQATNQQFNWFEHSCGSEIF